VSQSAAILRVLRDGERHSVSEIHRLAGTSRLNSRVAGLRSQGYDIRCELAPSPSATERYGYRLVSSPILSPEVAARSTVDPAVTPDPAGSAQQHPQVTSAAGPQQGDLFYGFEAVA
jgi:Helix-turn-helix domain